jgi:hypothetical protein
MMPLSVIISQKPILMLFLSIFSSQQSFCRASMVGCLTGNHGSVDIQWGKRKTRHE